MERTEWASVERNFVLEALNKGTIGRPKPGRRYENNKKLEFRETEGKFGDCMKLVVTDRDCENRATHGLFA